VRFVSPLRQRFPFGGVLLAAVFGILAASALGPGFPLAVLLAVAILFLAALRFPGSLFLGFAAVAFSLLQIWQWNEAPARKMALWMEGNPALFHVTGVVTGEPRPSSGGSFTFPLRLEKLKKEEAEEEEAGPGTPLTAPPITVQVRWEGETPAYGDRVAFDAEPARPSPPRNPGGLDYRSWLERHGIHTQFRVDPSAPGRILSSGHGNPLMRWAIAARHRMENVLNIDLPDSPDAVSAIRGICLGVTENAPEGFTDDFRFTGTMHLFSVSGLHVGMLAVIVWFALKAFRIPEPAAVCITIPALFFYVAVTGLKAGSIRSATMASILLLGTVLFRRAPLINSLAAAALLQLCIDTNTLFSAGWQFSYTVVFAILIAAPLIECRLRACHAPDPFLPSSLLTNPERLGFSCWHHLSSLAAVSAAAWIGSLVPTAAYFHLISFSALGANLLAVPLAFAVLSLGVLSLLGGTLSPWIAGAFNNANWIVAKALLLVVHASSLLPGGHWFLGPPGPSHPVMTILDVRGSSCAVLQRGNAFAMINAGRRRDALGTVLPFLESSGANSVREILITRADAAHLGGLPEIHRELRVKETWVPPGRGRSPIAKEVFSGLGSDAVRRQRIVPEKLCAGKSVELLPGVRASILWPPSGGEADFVIARVEAESLGILFLPRLDPSLSAEILSGIPLPSLRSDILILPLGGSDLASTLGVIRAVSPRCVISGSDAFGRRGMPSREWEGLLAGEGITLLRQDETGAVILDADPRSPRLIPYLHPDREISLEAPGSGVIRR